MAEISRRRLVGQAAAIAGGAALAGSVATHQAAAQDKTEITVYHIWGTAPGGTPAESLSPMNQVIEAFNAQSTTTFVNSQTPSTNYYEVLQKTQADIAAGNPPDLVSVPWAFLNYAVEGLNITPLADIAGDKFATLQGLMSDVAWPLVTKNDTVYGFPWGLSTPIFYYNADMFEAAGVDPAESFATWESFAAACPALQEQTGAAVFTLAYNKDWPAQTLIQCNGGRVLNDDGTFGITSEEAKEAMQTIADLDNQGFYDRGTRDELRPNFLAGSNAIWQGSVASLDGIANEVPFTFGTSTWPAFGDKPIQASTGGSFLGSFATDSARYPAIVEFLEFCGSEEGYSLWNQTGYINMSNVDLPRLEGQDPAYAQYEAGLILETNWPSARGVEAGSTWDVYCERMWANDISVEDGTTQALAEILEITGQDA